jgi:hypothetical protein
MSRRRRGQDGHREPDPVTPVTLRQFPVIWKEAEAEAEDGGRQVEPFPLLTSLTSSRFSVVLLRAGTLFQSREYTRNGGDETSRPRPTSPTSVDRSPPPHVARHTVGHI